MHPYSDLRNWASPWQPVHKDGNYNFPIYMVKSTDVEFQQTDNACKALNI